VGRARKRALVGPQFENLFLIAQSDSDWGGGKFGGGEVIGKKNRGGPEFQVRKERRGSKETPEGRTGKSENQLEKGIIGGAG